MDPPSLPLFFLLLATYLATLTSGSYRHFHVDNADLCNTGKLKLSRTKTLSLGSGAAILQLNAPSRTFQPNFYNKAKRCEIHVRAPDNHGLMAHVEEMHLRKSTRDGACTDYIQFGQDDIIPFMTYKKSERLCGEDQSRPREGYKSGFVYDDPSGNLLIWVSLGGRGQTSYWPVISVVNLTIVVTPYAKECVKPDPGYRRCGGDNRDRCIWKNYFCDSHFNCPMDLIPADEDGCEYGSVGLEHTTLNPGEGSDPEDAAALNVLTWTLIVVCLSLIALLLLAVLIRNRRNSRKCCQILSTSGSGLSCELPEGHHAQPRSLVELDRQRGTRETEDNIYLPLTTFVDQPIVGRGRGHVTTSIPPEEPPPAYDELFPEPNVVRDVAADEVGNASFDVVETENEGAAANNVQTVSERVEQGTNPSQVVRASERNSPNRQISQLEGE